MASYICVIECSDNHLYICDTKKVHLEELIPLRIVGLYNVDQNYTLFKTCKKPVSRHLTTLELDYETTRTDLVETILSDRHFYDRREGEWYGVRTGNVKQNRWMASVLKGYRECKKEGDSLSEPLAQTATASPGAPLQVRGYYASHRVSHLKAEEVDDRPPCDHGFPCEIHIGSETYFDCPLKYVWPDFMPELPRITPCKFKQVILA